MASCIAVIRMERVDSEPRTGIWCGHCNLPSGVSMTYTLQIGNGPLTLNTMSRCVECCEPVQP